MLQPYRVLDLTDERGHFAGFILAQLGAEVIAVEPPGGQRTRRQGPFADGVSIEHWAYARGKASLVLSDPADLDRLAASADVLLDSGAFRVDLDGLRRRHPRLVTVSITPFGGSGPKAGWAATDLIVAAASGVVSLTGDADRAPVRISEPQSWLHAAADGACGALIALHERSRSGLGQHVDVSAQESTMIATQHTMLNHLVGKPPSQRQGGGMQLGPFKLRFVFPCADGFATVFFVFGPMFGPYSKRLLAWALEEGFGDQALVDKNWVTFAADVLEGREARSEFDRAYEVLAAFVATRTKAELMAGALDRKLLIAPVTTTRDLLELEQLRVRNYWDPVDLAGRTVRAPGPFAVVAGAPLARLTAPSALGADTDRLLSEPRPKPSAEPAPADADGRPALDGVKILDLSWAIAGPLATRILVDHGARVVRVESETRPDPIRGTQPFHGDGPDNEGSLQWHSANAGKLSVTLDLSLPEARSTLLDLARWADVVVESFSPGMMARWGLAYADLQAVNPNVIMLSSCLLGQDGPIHTYAGVGTMGASLAGFYPSVGWPDRPPTGPCMAYTDYTSPRLTAAVIVAALDWRRRSGQGLHIDFSQVEAGLHFLSTALLDDEVNGIVGQRRGNADRTMVPHGVYPAAGDDRWLAVACESDTHWATLAGVIGQPDLARLTRDERVERATEIDKLVETWSSLIDAVAAQEQLQALGVPAHQVQNSPECVGDLQLVHRGHFIEVPHASVGQTFVEAHGFRLSRSAAQVSRAGPTFGEHNQPVLGEILGYDDERIANLVVSGAVT